MVNSLHSLLIADLAPGLVAEAVAEDGSVEAVNVEGAGAFALGTIFIRIIGRAPTTRRPAFSLPSETRFASMRRRKGQRRSCTVTASASRKICLVNRQSAAPKSEFTKPYMAAARNASGSG